MSPLLDSLRVSACLLLASLPAMGAPVISEFLADNADSLRDEDGQTSDWIEIHNPDVTPVALGGLSLTDDAAVPAKWVLPARTLPGKGALVVFASSKNRTPAAGELHASFQLAATGGYLALFAADGVTKLSEFTYGPQYPDRSWGSAYPVMAAPEARIVNASPCRWRVPTAAIPGWMNPTFNDSTWTAGVTGIGYDRITTGVSYLPYIGLNSNVEAQMYNLRPSCYVRIPFTVTDAGDVASMNLRVRYDDGFAAFLNGTPINPPAPSTTNAPDALAFDSLSPKVRADSVATVVQTFDISAHRKLLVSGTNVLAVQALNSALDSSDLVFSPTLDLRKLNTSAPLQTGFFPFPSPGERNVTLPVTDFTDAPDFSVKRKFATETFTVALTTKTPGASIRYTTNGTPPTASVGTTYSNPISISKTTTLRAIAYLAGWDPSTVKTHTYIFADQVRTQASSQPGFPATWGNKFDFATGAFSTVTVPADYAMDPSIINNGFYSTSIVPALTTTFPVMSISTEINGLLGTDGIYCNGRLDSDTEIPVSVEFFSPDHTEDWQENAGLRIHGGDAPLEHPKKPFRIYFRKKYGTDKLRHPLYQGSPVDEFDVLQLRGGGHDGWSVPFGKSTNDLAWHATYCRDRFLRDTERVMGRLSPHSRWVYLYLNGLFWGMYDLHEAPGADYFADHAGGEPEDWDVYEQPGIAGAKFDVVDGDAAAMNAVLALCTPPANLVNNSTYQQVQQYIDVDDFIDHLIVEMWGGNNDWMGPVFRGTGTTPASYFFNKNWDTGRRSRGASPGKFLWNVWDAEISMGSSLNLPGSPPMRVSTFDHSRIGTPGSGTAGPPGQIYHALRQNALFRRRFADRLHKHLIAADGVFVPENAIARLHGLRDQLDLPIITESARWGDVNNGVADGQPAVAFNKNTHWNGEMLWLEATFMYSRRDTMIGQFLANGIWPTVNAPTFSKYGGAVAPGFSLTMSNPNGGGSTLYYTLNGADPADPGALTYTGAIALTATGDVKARVQSGGVWSPLVEAHFIVGVPASGANLTVTEFCYNPSVSDAERAAGYTAQQFEYIELMNISGAAIDLDGCRFDDGVGFDFAASSTVLKMTAGQRIVIASNKQALLFRHPGLTVAGEFEAGTNLSNGGERIEILAANGTTIADFRYLDIAPWPVEADGSGFSLVLISPQTDPDLNLPANWRLSRVLGGSPGGVDTASTFAAWATTAGIPAPVNPLGDTNGNDIPALAEYGLGRRHSSPADGAGIKISVETVTVEGVPGTYCVMRYRRSLLAEDVTVTPQFTSDLTVWTNLTDAVGAPVPQWDATEEIAVRCPQPVTPDSKSWFRVSVKVR